MTRNPCDIVVRRWWMSMSMVLCHMCLKAASISHVRLQPNGSRKNHPTHRLQAKCMVCRKCTVPVCRACQDVVGPASKRQCWICDKAGKECMGMHLSAAHPHLISEWVSAPLFCCQCCCQCCQLANVPSCSVCFLRSQVQKLWVRKLQWWQWLFGGDRK